jgi:hypothetical protein
MWRTPVSGLRQRRLATERKKCGDFCRRNIINLSFFKFFQRGQTDSRSIGESLIAEAKTGLCFGNNIKKVVLEWNRQHHR